MAIYFDKDSVYEHRTGADGKFFDTFGNNQGYVDGEGRYYDANRVFKGTRKEDGMFYSADGRCLGYTDGKKWCFDAFGVFIESEREGTAKEKAPAEDDGKKGLVDSVKGMLRKE